MGEEPDPIGQDIEPDGRRSRRGPSASSMTISPKVISQSSLPVHMGVFQRKVLAAVASLGDQAFGAALARHLTAVEGRDVSQPQVVATLTKLVGLGLLTKSTVLPDEPRQGYRRHNAYDLTEAGIAALHAGGTR